MPIIFNQPETSTSHPTDRPPWFWTDPFFLTAYINTSQLISNTTIPNDNMFHTPRNPKPRKPRTALVFYLSLNDSVNLKSPPAIAITYKTTDK